MLPRNCNARGEPQRLMFFLGDSARAVSMCQPYFKFAVRAGTPEASIGCASAEKRECFTTKLDAKLRTSCRYQNHACP